MMRLLRLLSALLLALGLVTAAVGQPSAEGKLRISYLFSDGNMPGTLAAFRQLLDERPDLKGKVELELLAESTVDEVDPVKIAQSDVLIFDVMNEQMLGQFNQAHKVDLVKQVAARGLILGVGMGLQNDEAYANMGVVWEDRARAYWEHGGPENQLGLLKYALTKAGVKGLELPEVQKSLDFGYYYPDGANGQVFADWASFQAWRAANGKLKSGAPRIAVGFFKASYYSGDMALIDALIAEIEKRGAEVVPLFGYPGAVAFQQLLVSGDERRADAALGLSFQFSDARAAEALEGVDIPVVNVISLYGRSEAEWRASTTGLSAFEGTFNLATPELAGTIAPTVAGAKEKVTDPVTGMTSVIVSPIQERVQISVSRALRYAQLRLKPNADKKLAMLFYNFPAGKAGISASYLNVAETIANTLKRLDAEGYDVGGTPPTADEVLADLTTKARNIGSDAPGELEDMLALADHPRVSLEDYRGWLNALAPSLRDKVLKDWGDPADSKVMVERIDGQVNFIMPAVRYGNIVLMPQPARGWGEDMEQMYHAKDLAPHHQYVAAYTWLRKGFGADAVVHIGTHGTLEWLDGRDVGLADDDAPDALIGDLPNAYIYNVDVVGEGLVARRRSMATLVDHMVPPFIRGDLTESLAELSGLLNDHIQNESKNPELAKIYADQARTAAVKLGVAKDLGLDPDQPWSDEELHSVEEYLLELKQQVIPYGLHAFGRTPAPEAVDSTVDAIMAIDRSMLPDARELMAQDMRGRIVASGPRELDGLVKALSGRFVPAGMGGEPVRNPDSYPTGKNFYGIDPDKVPKPAAWEMGHKLANEMIADYRAKHGRYPSKISFVIWGDETMRHEGVLEAQIFTMLGTKPVWDARGKVVDVEVIPRAQLGRPRIDIVIASASEGLFSNVTRLMDKAVQSVKGLEEADNQVRAHYLQTKKALIERGVAPEDADRMAGVRIFDEPPGSYNLNTSTIVAASGTWDDEAGFANDYIRKMGHGYGNGYWGQPMPDVFKMALSGTETIVHSNSTMLYGTLDNDDMYMYMGGLSSAIRSLDGKAPEMLITDTRDPGKPAMTSVGKFVGREFRSRYVNPAWIRGMQKEGYAGAGAMREFVEYLWGWEATTQDVVDDGMWQETYETYVEDKNNLGMKEYFSKNSPFAYQDITARMIETIRKNYWKADEGTRNRLVREYLESVTTNGVNCTGVSCGNARLLRYVMEHAEGAGVPAPMAAGAKAALEKAMGRTIESAAQELEDFARRNDAREQASQQTNSRRVNESRDATSTSRPVNGPAHVPSPSSTQRNAQSPEVPDRPSALEGSVMTAEDRTQSLRTVERPMMPTITMVDAVWPALVFLGLLFGWRKRETRGSNA
jgi:cobaltochelatase CobN